MARLDHPTTPAHGLKGIENMKFILVILALILFAGLGLALAQAGKKAGRAGTYKRRKLMTDNELEFFGTLIRALPEHYVFPQAAMSALLESSSSDKKVAHSDRLRIAQQRVDYLVCDSKCEVVAVIELDDKTHTKSKDDMRDARLAQAGIKVVRFQSRSKPSIETIRGTLLAASSVPAEVDFPARVRSV